MRTSYDALRSLHKYTYECLTKLAATPQRPWTVTIADEEGTFRRPFAKIEAPPSGTLQISSRIHSDARLPCTIVCHPVESRSAGEALAEALRVEEALFQALRVGHHQPTLDYQRTRRWPDLGHQMRIPLYDFAGVPITKPVGEDRRGPRDFMKVVWEPAIGRVPDPDDPLRWAVTASITMSWSRMAAVPSDAVVVEGVPVHTEDSH